MQNYGPINSKKIALHNIAAEQYGYFTSNQAIEIGYVKDHHRYHVKQSNWLKISKGLFRLHDYPDSMKSEFTKWCLWSRNQKGQIQGVISHNSALALHGLGEYNPSKIHLTVPIAFRKKTPKNLVIHKASLNLSAIEGQNSFMTTRLAKTLHDMRIELEENGQWNIVYQRAISENKLSGEEMILYGMTSLEPIPDSVAKGDSSHATLSTKATPFIKCPNLERGFDAISEGVWEMISNRTEAIRRKSRAGFTLVELLVVIAIISILAAMLMPALGKALKSARSTACTNQLSQIGKAMAFYAGDHGDFPPRILSYDSVPGYFWFRVLEMQGYCGAPTTLDNISSARRGTLFICPDDDDPYEITAALGWGKQQFVSYGLSAHVLGRPAEYGYYHEDYMTFTQIDHLAKRSSGTVLGTDTAGWYSFYAHSHKNDDPFLDNPPQYLVDPRHAKAANFLFADMHVKSIMAPFGAPGLNSKFLYPNIPDDLRR